jgi:carbohydrate-selective porin OprB
MTSRRSRAWRRNLRRRSGTADSCGFNFYCGVVLYSQLQPMPRPRITNRSLALTATKPVRGRTAFGDWGGERTRLQERGVNFDFQYVSDSLWNLKSVQKERFASWNRFRGTVDIDLGELTGHQGWYFHATALWQGGGNLGKYLGLLTSPSGMASQDTCRLDSWWIEKRWLNERITARVGQFAGQDFYGAQHDAASFIFEPMGPSILPRPRRWRSAPYPYTTFM